tara:strand:+ start:418 stop:852 length:435 start_codon:yes stop_codon:yes gene_type:complete
MNNSPVYKQSKECNLAGTFTNESKDTPDKMLVENLGVSFPELPLWMLNAAVLCHNKNPNYMTTGILGKKPLTGKEKRIKKRQEFTATPEWFGETPEDRKKDSSSVRSQSEALQYMKLGPLDDTVIRKTTTEISQSRIKKIVEEL